MRDARPSDWFIAGMFFTFGALAAALLIAAVVGLFLLLGLVSAFHR
jgi:hypothetical protein